MPAAVPYLAWPVPAALGVVLGIAAHAAGMAPQTLAGLALVTLAAAVPLLRRWAPRARPRWLPWLALLLALPVGAARLAQREARPMPLTALTGRVVELTGHSDGRFLRPRGARVGRLALAPAGSVPAGEVRVRGRVVAPEGKRNPGGFDYAGWLRRRDVSVQLLVERATVLRPARGARARLRRGVVRGLDGERAALMEAMTLGVREGLGPLRDRFARAGLAHVLALSGLHLGVLVAVAGRLLRVTGPARAPLLLGLLASFVALVGPSPSVVRAAAMAGAATLTIAAGAGRLQPFVALALAGLGTLLARPDWLFDVAFQLSYLSLLGLIVFASPLAEAWSGMAPAVPRRARDALPAALAASAAATVPTLSLVADAFGRVPLAGPLINLPALPLASALVPLGFAAGVLGALAPPLAALPNALVRPLAGALLELARLGANAPALHWGEVAGIGHAFFALGVAPWALVLRGWLRPWRALALGAAAMACSLAAPAPHPPPEAVVMDVGQGDAVLLRLPGRVEVLIDGGGTPFSDYDVGAGTVLPALRALGVDELELVVASHPDADHVEGLASVLREMPTQALAYGLPDPEKAVWRALVDAAEARGVRTLPLRRGQRLRLGEAELRVLHPPAGTRRRGNEASLALSVRWRGRPWALLLGDVGAEVERGLAVPATPLLLAPHHGSPGSTSDALLRAARPRLVAISVGRNAYGHPAAEVLERIAGHGAELRRTDRGGAIRSRPAW